jgi:hypothetical protein
MACRLDVEKAILDQAFNEMFEGRYTFTRLTDDTVRINNRLDDPKSKALTNTQARKIAEQKLKAVISSFKNAIGGYVSQYSPYDPITITLNVNPDYVEHEYQKLPEDQKTDPKDRGERGVKPGVEELFDSNPELANQVYEAMGLLDRTQRYKNQMIDLMNISDEQKQQALQLYSQYLDTGKQDIEGFKRFVSKQGMFQLPGTEVAKASPKTIALIKDFLKRIGVDIKTLQQIEVNGVKQDANGAAMLMQKLVQVVEGKEAEALPEEALHFAVSIIKQTNPALYKKLLSEINSYRIMNEVFATYSKLPSYQIDGKPDVVKLKEEAIGKVLTQVLINKNEGSVETPEKIANVQTWWQKIIQALKNLFAKSGFDQLAMDIISGKQIGTAEDIREEQDYVLFQKNPQQAIYDMIKEVAAKIEKKNEKYYVDGKVINRRVTDLVNDWYTRRFNDKDLTKSEYQTAVDDLKAKKGTAGHAAKEYAFSRFVDENGFLRETPLSDDTYIAKFTDKDGKVIFSQDMYQILRDNLETRLKSFPAGTRFMSEATIYDPKRNLAGTVDFLAITPNGEVSILDWKFMALKTEKYQDVPWYKVNGWRQQMEQYKLILQSVYGVRPENFRQTRMIPIQAIYSEGNAKANILPQLLSVKIGDVNVKNITEDYLLPVGLESEKTGNKKIDALIEKLNAVYKKLSEKKALPSEKLSKAEQLNELFTAIRQLQVKGNLNPLVRQARILNKQVQKTIQIYKDKFAGQNPSQFSEKEVNDFAQELQTVQDAISIYVTLDTDLSDLFIGDLSEEELNLEKELNKAAGDARKLQSSLNDILNDYTSEIIAKSVGVDSLLSPEKIIKGITRLFSSTATLQLKALETLYKKANKAFAFAGFDTQSEIRRLSTLKDAYTKWASGKGLSQKNYFDILKKKTSNELIDEFNPEFYSTLKKKIEEKDTQWIINNINPSEYNEFLKKKLEEEFERIDNKHRIGTDAEINAEISREKANARQLYNTSTLESPGWLLYDFVKQFPNREKWESKEWKELTKPENKPAFDFYNYIKEKNEEYRELGYIGRREARTFLPFVRKGLVEKLITGGNVRLGEQFFRDISIDEGDIGYGKIDPINGKTVDSIPKYFTTEVEGELSTDLFRTMSLYNEAAIRYKYINEIEQQIRAIVRVEANKKAIATSMFGKTEYKDGVLQYSPNNNENTKLVEDMMKAIIYGQKFIQSETFDQLLGKLGNWGDKINQKLGMKIFPENLSEKQVSVNKIINQLNNSFQLVTLGINPLSASSNFFGGNAQSIINSGKYFTKSDYIASEGMLFIGKLANTDDRKKLLGALEYFLPLTENYNKDIASKLSLNKLNQQNIQDFLMIMMRKTDWAVQTANFYSFLKNSIVENGEVVNAREFLRAQPKYQNLYSNTVEKRKALEQEFEEDVKKLVEEKGVLKIAQIVNNEFVIPGVDRKSDSVIKLRRTVQQISKDALGNLTEDDVRTINMNIYGKSFMVFKNWIPRLVDVRMGNLKYNNASDAYEWGRMRMVYRIMSEDLIGSLNNLYNSLVANEKGVDYMRQLFQKKKDDYEKDTGKELNMTEDEFINLVRQNIKGQMIDVLFLTTMFLLVTALKANMPDDDEDPAVKAQYRFVVKMADKFKDELMYFYDPTSLQQLISGGGVGLFPAIGLVNNFRKGVKNFFVENWALATGDDETVEKTKVIKYWMKTFPFTNQMAGYLPMFYPELAKDLGLKIQSNYGIR